MKQLAGKLAMTADLLKYSPHSEITDVHWDICVNIWNLLSVLFSFYLPLINSSLLQDHLPPESPEVFFPTRGLPHLTSPWSYIISFLKKGIFVPLAFNYLSSSLPSHATPALAYFTSATGLPALLQTHQACPYPRVLAVLFLERSSSGRSLASFSPLFQVFAHVSPSQCVWLDNCV